MTVCDSQFSLKTCEFFGGEKSISLHEAIQGFDFVYVNEFFMHFQVTQKKPIQPCSYFALVNDIL